MRNVPDRLQFSVTALRDVVTSLRKEGLTREGDQSLQIKYSRRSRSMLLLNLVKLEGIAFFLLICYGTVS